MDSSVIKTDNKKIRIILGITGSVAGLKGPELALLLSKHCNAHVVVLLTRGGENFWLKSQYYNKQSWDEFHSMQHNHVGSEPDNVDDMAANLPLPSDSTSKIVLFRDQDEWISWNKMNDPVLHIKLRDWADIVVIAPLSAHSLAKLANGLCDDTLSCVMRAWDFGQVSHRSWKPIVVCPAMNTGMWHHPLTQIQLGTVKRFFVNAPLDDNHPFVVLEPHIKYLACGETGIGAMASVVDIVEKTKKVLSDIMYNDC